MKDEVYGIEYDWDAEAEPEWLTTERLKYMRLWVDNATRRELLLAAQWIKDMLENTR